MQSAREINDAVGACFSTRTRSIASITTSARRPCRTCSRCASPTRCSNRCGAAARSITCRSRWPRISASAAVVEFYDRIGALRDMVQNHLLQLVCLFAMEPPSQSRSRRRARRENQGAASAAADFGATDVRGQHRARPVHGRRDQRQCRAGLRSTSSAEASSTTETFVALKLEIDNWRWSNVPFYLRTGKRLQAQALGDRRAVPGRAAFDIPGAEVQRAAEPAAHPPAAGRGREAVGHGERTRSRRIRLAAGIAGPEFRGDLRYALSGCLRAPADGGAARQPGAVHAP